MKGLDFSWAMYAGMAFIIIGVVVQLNAGPSTGAGLSLIGWLFVTVTKLLGGD